MSAAGAGNQHQETLCGTGLWLGLAIEASGPCLKCRCRVLWLVFAANVLTHVDK